MNCIDEKEKDILYIKQGDTLFIDVDILDEEKEPIPFPNCEALLQMRRGHNNSPVLSLSTENGDLVLTDGNIKGQVSSTITQEMFGNGYLDLQITFEDGTVRTYWGEQRWEMVKDYAYKD